MRYYRFLPYSLAATTTWALVTGTVGYVFGAYWQELLSVARSVGYGFVALIALFVVLYVFRRYRARNKRNRED